MSPTLLLLQVDKYFVGELPPKQITFTNLNDNVREQFLRSMCERYGDVESIKIYHHPKTKKHLGLASVTYTKTRYAKDAAMGLNRTSVMGRIIIVQVDAGGMCPKSTQFDVDARQMSLDVGGMLA